jgi:hypothetical protein
MSTDVAAIQSNFLYHFSIIAMPNGYNGTSKILEIHSIKQPLQLEMKVKYHTVQSKVLTNSCFYKLLISLPHRLHFPHFLSAYSKLQLHAQYQIIDGHNKTNLFIKLM